MRNKIALLNKGILLALSLLAPTDLTAAPSIDWVRTSSEVILPGQTLTISAQASATVVQATATVDFRPMSSRLLRVPLARVAGVWNGSVLIPADIVTPLGSQATIRVLAFDSLRQQAQSTIKVSLSSQPAMFVDGVLTVTGSAANDALRLTVDPEGKILVNQGALPVTGGTPTVLNTSRIVVMGLEGDDALYFGGLGVPIHAIGGGGNDSIVLNGLFGNGLVEGGAGDDTVDFTGMDVPENLPPEHVTLASIGSVVRLSRDPGGVRFDITDVEAFEVHTRDGGIVTEVMDLAGTGVREVRMTPSSFERGVNTLMVAGTEADDEIWVEGVVNNFVVHGLVPIIRGVSGGFDRLVIKGLGGNDRISLERFSANAVPWIAFPVTLDGGDGDDVLIGRAAPEALLGGPGNDTLIGNGDFDVIDQDYASLGISAQANSSLLQLRIAGTTMDDMIILSRTFNGEILVNHGTVPITGGSSTLMNLNTAIIEAGDGDDTVVRDAALGYVLGGNFGGVEHLVIRGGLGHDEIQVSALGSLLRLYHHTRTGMGGWAEIYGDVIQDIFVETGIADDRVAVADISATSVAYLGVHYSSEEDFVYAIVDGTSASDAVAISGVGSVVALSGLRTLFEFSRPGPVLLQMTVNGRGGDDLIDASLVQPGLLALKINGNEGNDTLIGSEDDDIITGGEGDDFLWGRGGNDTLDGGPGVNTVVQD